MNEVSVARHQTRRLRHETRRRQLTVAKSELLTPKMLRLEFTCPDLRDFVSASPDDHIKLFFPDSSSEKGVASRDYTPRAFDTATGRMTIDFALHDSGCATDWATGAKPGDILEIGGPRGSAVIADDFDSYLLIGDETALPAIGRRVEEFSAGQPVTTLVVLDGPQDRQTFETQAGWTPIWVYRTGEGDDAALLRRELAKLSALPGDTFVWIAAEASVAKSLKTHFLVELGHPADWIKSAGYWVQGAPGASEKM
jgi:NADPH-dependent ferric siderophore reductase